MSLMDMLAAAQGGRYFASVAEACGMHAVEAEQALSRIAPAIAEKLHDKAAEDADAFENLLELLEDGGNSSDLDDPQAITGAEAVSDGEAVLKDIYGSDAAARTAMKALAPGVADASLVKLSAIGATSVLASLARSYSAPLPLAGATGSAGGGLLGTIISAVVEGAMKGAARQLAPKRRRRRRYSSYWGAPRRRTRRRRPRQPSLNDIFGSILGRR
jgi:hypothetical protein